MMLRDSIVAFSFVAAFCAVSACGSSHSNSPDASALDSGPIGIDAHSDAGDSDAGPFDDSGLDSGSPDAASDAGDSDAGMCVDTFSRECEFSSDCAAGWFADCCGGASARGIRAEDAAAYEMFAEACQPLPVCDCVPTLRDEQGNVVKARDEVTVSCVQGQCIAHVLACENGVTNCGEGLSCCYPCGIPGCSNQCEPSCTSEGCFEGCALRP